jgi:hypothetical protein
MKKIIFSFLLSMFVVAIVAAQPPQRSMGPRGKGPRPSRENVEALKVAFMTKHLNLNVDEAQKFWPAYNACTEELKKARQEKKEDILAFEEAALNIRKKYRNEFKKVLGSDDRANKALTADRAFMGMIKDELQNRKGGMPGSKKKGNGAPPPPPPPGQEAPAV